MRAAGWHGQHKRASTSQEGAWAMTHRPPPVQVLHSDPAAQAVPPRSGRRRGDPEPRQEAAATERYTDYERFLLA
jgi:hypothetical protein